VSCITHNSRLDAAGRNLLGSDTESVQAALASSWRRGRDIDPVTGGAELAVRFPGA
jgi:hypothetical protein